MNTFDGVQASFTLSVFAAISSVIFFRCVTATVYMRRRKSQKGPLREVRARTEHSIAGVNCSLLHVDCVLVLILFLHINCASKNSGKRN